MPTKYATTAKQRACTHPPAHVHATYDDRYEICDLCHIIRPRPLPAPWIEAYDASQPSDPAPALFSEGEPEESAQEPKPAKRPRSPRQPKASQPAAAAAAAPAMIREEPEPGTFRDLLARARRDRAVMGTPVPWKLRAPSLDEAYTPDQITTCHRCDGAGTIEDQHAPTGTYETLVIDGKACTFPHVARSPIAGEPRTCPRCGGVGRIPKYTARACQTS
jgi:hypothetical protein